MKILSTKFISAHTSMYVVVVTNKKYRITVSTEHGLLFHEDPDATPPNAFDYCLDMHCKLISGDAPI